PSSRVIVAVPSSSSALQRCSRRPAFESLSDVLRPKGRPPLAARPLSGSFRAVPARWKRLSADAPGGGGGGHPRRTLASWADPAGVALSVTPPATVKRMVQVAAVLD